MKPYYAEKGTRGITIYHGDAQEVLPSFSSEFITLVTDPPYGIKLRSSRSGSFGDCAIEGDETTAARDYALKWAEGRPAICFGTWRIARPTNTRAILIWDKGEHVGMGDLEFPWKPNFEEIYIIGKGFKGSRSTSVLRCFAIAGTVALSVGRHHPTEKPVILMRELISKCPPSVIADPFMGSGSTLLAAKQLGRRAWGIEVEERYCEIAAERLRQQVFDFSEPERMIEQVNLF